MRTFVSSARPWAILAALFLVASVLATGPAGGGLAVGALFCGFTAGARYLRRVREESQAAERANIGASLLG